MAAGFVQREGAWLFGASRLVSKWERDSGQVSEGFAAALMWSALN